MAHVKILYIVDSLCDWGGAERILRRMTRQLSTDRYRCTIITFRTHPSIGDLGEFDCPVHVWPMRRTYGLCAVRTAWKIRELIRSEGIDIVHTFFETADLWGGLVSRLSGATVLISSRRDMGTQRSRKHMIGYRLLGWMFDQVQAVSGSVRDFCIANDHFPPQKVITIHNGVECLPMQSLEPTPVEFTDASDVILSVGHVKRVKGYDVLIRAAARVVARFPKAVFAIVGDIYDQAYFHQLRAASQNLGIAGNIRFVGKRADVPNLLRQAKVFCLLSRSEGLSNALLEAMAYGLPCIATRVGGNPELVEHDSSGFLVPNEDAEAAASRILDLLQNPVRARQMGTAGRRTVESRFTTDSMIGRLAAEYDRLLQSKLGSPALAQGDAARFDTSV